MGVNREFKAEPISGTVIMMPIAMDNSEPLNHLQIMALWAMTKFSEQTPKNALPISIIT